MKTIKEVNQLGSEDFSSFLGWTFEESHWLSNRLWRKKPFESYDDIRIKVKEVLTEATPDEQLALIKSHPDLGTRTEMTTASQNEQENAGLQSLTSENFRIIQSLNQQYRQRFDFPFILAVREKTVSQIIDTLRTRLEQTPEDERHEALRQISAIVFGRIQQALAEA